MGNLKEPLPNFVWGLNDSRRAGLCLSLGLVMLALGWWREWEWEITFLCGWIMTLTAYLVLLGMVIFTADAARTRAGSVAKTSA